MISAKDLIRFWSYVQFPSTWTEFQTDACWLWEGGKRRKGYGGFYVAGGQVGAHRFAWMTAHGVVPDGMHVLHSCDTPSCVRPSHLRLGTNKDNHAERAAKGRSYVGSRRTRPILTTEQVRELRALHASGETKGALARRLNISWQSVDRAVRGETFREVA